MSTNKKPEIGYDHSGDFFELNGKRLSLEETRAAWDATGSHRWSYGAFSAMELVLQQERENDAR